MKPEIKPFLADGKTHRCRGNVWTGISFFQCRSQASKKRRANIFRQNEPGWYCGLHDPQKRKARQIKSRKVRPDKLAAREVMFPKLIAAIEALLECSGDQEAIVRLKDKAKSLLP